MKVETFLWMLFVLMIWIVIYTCSLAYIKLTVPIGPWHDYVVFITKSAFWIIMTPLAAKSILFFFNSEK